MKDRPCLRPSLKRCARCGIFFLTDPRNRGRKDLRCPFGCRDSHRRQASAERSREYYGSLAGKEKKRALNRKRRRAPSPDPGVAEQPGGEAGSREVDPSEIDTRLVSYLCVVVSLIEGRKVSHEEITDLIRRAVRQHSLARERRIDYVLRTLKEKPP